MTPEELFGKEKFATDFKLLYSTYKRQHVVVAYKQIPYNISRILVALVLIEGIYFRIEDCFTPENGISINGADKDLKYSNIIDEDRYNKFKEMLVVNAI